jgi:hypothetical protein
MVEGIIETDLAEKVWLVVRPYRTKKRKAEVAREIKTCSTPMTSTSLTMRGRCCGTRVSCGWRCVVSQEGFCVPPPGFGWRVPTIQQPVHDRICRGGHRHCTIMPGKR